MDIGLHRFRIIFREKLNFLLPFFKKMNPNFISFLILPTILLSIATFSWSKENIHFYWLVIFLLLLRIVFASLDGHVAILRAQKTLSGEFFNRFFPELADILLFASLLSLYNVSLLVSVLFLGVAWMSSYLGLLGLLTKKEMILVGPFSQTDRMAFLIVFTFLEYFARLFEWDRSFIRYFFEFGIFAGGITVLNRIWRQLC